jgi:hypothetical protein
VPELKTDVAVRLQVRVGIATGLVVVGRFDRLKLPRVEVLGSLYPIYDGVATGSVVRIEQDIACSFPRWGLTSACGSTDRSQELEDGAVCVSRRSR